MLETSSFTSVGEEIAWSAIPTLIVQEVGDISTQLGTCVSNFFQGF